MKDECDINKIMAKYQKTGLVTHVNNYGAQYADMPDPSDFTDAMNLITEAQSMFEDLPSETRLRFRNDPAQFLDFVSDESNRDELTEMGLAAAAPPAEALTLFPEGQTTPEPPTPTEGDPAAS